MVNNFSPLDKNVHKIMNNNQNVNEALLELKTSLKKVNRYYLNLGFQIEDLQRECLKKSSNKNNVVLSFSISLAFISFFYQFGYFGLIINYILGVRCIVPNNYFVWEATRPLSDCNFCMNVSKPFILTNLSRIEFEPYAYSSKPIIVKKAFLHWTAINTFSLKFFQRLYNQTEDSYKSVDEECQFLHFKSNFISIQDVFTMNERRSNNDPSEKSWYVGWGNCHPTILEEMRKHYPKPHFLPKDCEMPSKDYIFMGYDDGATMHLDFINRLMWQAQLKGSKIWYLLPPPECQHTCGSVSFQVDPGDAVLVDTRIWYHGTTILPGEFSLSVQSEYG